MSAIFGILDLEGRPVDPAWIKSMQDDLAHRGPDGQGLYKEHSLVLGNMLLQVTPESVYDKSPYEEGGLVITVNARLDEREALMDRLNIPTEEREKITDPVLLLRSFKKFGKDFVKDIYGDFTFAIWDKERKELFCARDQMGVKPFLYYFQDNRLVFCTELKAIVRLPFVKTEIDHLYLRNKALYIWDEPERTTWKSVSRLRPAHTLSFVGSNLVITQYWAPKYKRNKKFTTEEDSATALRKILEKVISDHTRVIGSVGVPLSGGLDSSTIACLAARKLNHQGKKLTTASSILDPGVNATFKGNEIEFINEVLQQEKNIDPTFVYDSELGFNNELEKMFNQCYAIVNGFYYVDEAIYKKFHTKSIRRVLSGFLGDLTASNHAIYPFTLLLLGGRFSALYKLLSKVKIHGEQPLSAFIKNGILNELAPKAIQKTWNKIRNKSENPWNINEHPLKLSQKDKKYLEKKVLNSFSMPNVNLGTVSKNIWPTNKDQFEEDGDCGSSHHHIEMTYPLCDRRVVELLLQIPVEHFYAGGIKRGLLRKAMAGILPEKIRKRTNKGFYAPGYPVLIKKEIPEILAILENSESFNETGNYIDRQKLNFELQNLSESKNHDSFTYKVWVLVELIMWTRFASYFKNKL